FAGTTQEGSIFHSLVVPANAGTHTPCPLVLVAVATTFSLIERRWLWVPAFAGTTQEGSIFHSFVVPANAGTHTLCYFDLVAVATTFSLIERRWLWVPAFAGTTKEDSSNGQTVIACGAKQSISRQRKYGLIRRFAPR